MVYQRLPHIDGSAMLEDILPKGEVRQKGVQMQLKVGREQALGCGGRVKVRVVREGQYEREAVGGMNDRELPTACERRYRGYNENRPTC